MFIFILPLFVTLVVSTPIENNNTYREIIVVRKIHNAIEILDNSGTKNSDCICQIDNALQKIREDYKHTPGVGIHKFHRTSATFNEARKICIEEGGHLAVINSPIEATVLLGIFSKSKIISSDNFAFIGVHCLFSKNDWVTILGDSIYKAGYDGWGNGQPDDFDDKENCGALESDGTLHDVSCDSSHPFFCEIELPREKIIV